MSFQYSENIVTENIAYKAGLWIKPQGVFLHSLGCPGMTVEEAIESMNTGADSSRMGVHAIIDVNSVYVTLPIDILTKESMRNIHGGLSSNDTHIGIEMTEPDSIQYIGDSKWIDLNQTKTKSHISQVYQCAVEYVAQLCEIFEWNPLKPGVIMTHKSGYEAGIATAYADPDNIWDKLGFSLEQFKLDVYKHLNS
jgi:hypothetical protein